jgi:hypothetical protein
MINDEGLEYTWLSLLNNFLRQALHFYIYWRLYLDSSAIDFENLYS